MTPDEATRVVAKARERADRPCVWGEGEVPRHVAEYLWDAVHDRRVLLEALASTDHPDVRAGRVARLVATYWRDAVMASERLHSTGMSHPLAMVLAAFDGETEPVALGINEADWPAFRAALSATSEPT
jgi:hypothetical protein